MFLFGMGGRKEGKYITGRGDRRTVHRLGREGKGREGGLCLEANIAVGVCRLGSALLFLFLLLFLSSFL